MMIQSGFPEAADSINPDAMQAAYYAAIGAPPTILRDAEQIAGIRQARAEQQQQQMMAEQGMAMAQSAKTLAETPTDGDTALTAMLGAMAG
jgi:hypothetical protein